MSQFNSGFNIPSAPSVQSYSTLTGQQQKMADQLQGRVKTAGAPVSLDPAATASYINKSVAVPLLQQYDQTIMPRLKDSFASVGALMGSRRGFASQQALQNLQNTIGQQLGQAQLQNQQLSAQQALAYNQLGAGMIGQSHMALQPYMNYGDMLSHLLGGQSGAFGGMGGAGFASGGGPAQFLGAGQAGAAPGAGQLPSFSDMIGGALNGATEMSAGYNGPQSPDANNYSNFA